MSPLLQMSLDEICSAFWDTKEGRSMRDQLDNHPFDKCAGSKPRPKYCTGAVVSSREGLSHSCAT